MENNTSDMVLSKLVAMELHNFHVCVQNLMKRLQKKKSVKFQHNKAYNRLRTVLNSW